MCCGWQLACMVMILIVQQYLAEINYGDKNDACSFASHIGKPVGYLFSLLPSHSNLNNIYFIKFF